MSFQLAEPKRIKCRCGEIVYTKSRTRKFCDECAAARAKARKKSFDDKFHNRGVDSNG